MSPFYVQRRKRFVLVAPPKPALIGDRQVLVPLPRGVPEVEAETKHERLVAPAD